MQVRTFICKALSKVYKKLNRKNFYSVSENCIYDRQSANDVVYRCLASGNPIMLTRYGSIEMSVANTFRIKNEKTSIIHKIIDYIVDRTDLPWIDSAFYVPISRNAGVFNPTPEILERFANRYLEDSKIADVIMSVNYKEKFMPLPSHCQFIHFESIYPFFVDNPWTRILNNKRVLVIHPFAKTIEQQYARRGLLFENKEILPEFTLLTYKPVQSAAYEDVQYKDWFEALDKMETDIDRLSFDIAILGCGAYGLPLAAHIKRLGKQAIHMGGGTQLLFGIKGRRWEVEYSQPGAWMYNTPQKIDVNYPRLFNEYWVRPSEEERPKNATIVEGGCYW